MKGVKAIKILLSDLKIFGRENHTKRTLLGADKC